eukprot:scaffold8024_cov101-Isochrysis_galbana.AAC.1
MRAADPEASVRRTSCGACIAAAEGPPPHAHTRPEADSASEWRCPPSSCTIESVAVEKPGRCSVETRGGRAVSGQPASSASSASAGSPASPHRNSPSADATSVWKPPQPKIDGGASDGGSGGRRAGTSSRSIPAGGDRQSCRAASSPHDHSASPPAAPSCVAASAWKPHTRTASTRGPS